MGSRSVSEGRVGDDQDSSRFVGPSQSAYDDIRRQLERILASDGFARAERMSRFLRFVVEQTLRGRGDQLKEYLIGVEVFDRRESFDPRIDPVVRGEARRLRLKLKEYYDSEGQNDPVRDRHTRHLISRRADLSGLRCRPVARPSSRSPLLFLGRLECKRQHRHSCRIFRRSGYNLVEA